MTVSGSRRKRLFDQRIRAFLERQSASERLHLEGAGSTSLAAWFLGPKGENKDVFTRMIVQAIERNCQDRNDYHPEDPPYVTPERRDAAYRDSLAALQREYDKLLANLRGSVPFFSHRYQAHMNWELTLPGLLGYFSAMLYNQNNVAAEASPVTAQLEALVGQDLCTMLGLQAPGDGGGDITPWGHVTCDGSVANLEAMWAARNLKYYPVSVVQALRRDPRLEPARGLKVTLLDGTRRPLLDLDDWTLLNLPIDQVLALTANIEREFGIDSAVVTQALDPYLLQSMGFNGFCRSFLPDTPAPVVLGSATKHYSWPKNAAIVGIGKDHFLNVDVDDRARLSVDGKAYSNNLDARLKQCLAERRPVIMAVAVMGSTEESAVDPLAQILALRDHYRAQGLEFAVHTDAAWGGYFASMLRDPAPLATSADSVLEQTPAMPLSDYVTHQYQALPGVESITVDPHKAGYIPYPAGGLCYRNGSMRSLVAFLAPEVFHGSSAVADMGVYGVEGSKPGAAAAAVYLSHRVIRPDRSGYGRILGQALFNSRRFYSSVITLAGEDDPFIVVPVQMIPAERDGGSSEQIKQQLQFIRQRIVERQNNELVNDPEAMALLAQLGSDQIIITYAFNFIGADGRLNPDPAKANAFNHALFEQLSVTPDRDQVMSRPLFITTSEFEPAVYGTTFVQTFMRRLGVDHETPITMNFLSSTTMSPWLTATADGDFIPTLRQALYGVVLEQAEKFRSATPDPEEG